MIGRVFTLRDARHVAVKSTSTPGIPRGVMM
jgi:hypothetical protein